MALSVGELAAVLDLDSSKFDRGMDDADNKRGRLSEGMGKVGTAAAAGFALAGTAAIGFGTKATLAASSLNETASKSGAVFKDQAGAIDKWASGAAKSFGQSKQQALEAASSYGNMFVQLGIARDKAADMSMQMTELASDFASFHDADPAEVIESMGAAFRGEYDSVQKFVPTINAAAVEAKALEMGLAGTTKELTQQDKALATQALLMSGAGDAMGDFDKTADSLANRMRTAKASTEDFSARVGSQLLPVVLDAWDAFDKITPVIGEGLKGAFDTAKGAIEPVTAALSDFFGNAGNYSVDELMKGGQAEEDMNGLQKAIRAVGNTDLFGNPGNYSLPELLQAGGAQEDMNGLQSTIATLGADVFGNPGNYSLKELFKAGEAQEDMSRAQALIATIGGTLQSIFSDASSVIGTVFGDIKTWVDENEGRIEGWKEKLGEIFGQVVEIVTLAWELLGAVFSVASGAILRLWSLFGEQIISYLAGALDAVLQIVGGVLEIIKGIFNVFIGIFTGDWDRAWQGVKQIFGGVWDVIVGLFKAAMNLFDSIMSIATTALSNAWSKTWSGIKEFFSGIWDGIVSIVTKGKEKLIEIVSGIGTKVTEAISGAFDGVKSAFIGALNWIIGKWNDLSFQIPSVDVPGIGKIGGGTIDTPNIPLLATGGHIVGSGLAVVGERGPELLALNRGASVLPLDSGGSSRPPELTIENLNINGVQDGDSLRRALPDLEAALVAVVGRTS